MKDELMKCPFCGNDNFNLESTDPVIIAESKDCGQGLKGEAIKVYCVMCLRCGARGGPGVTGYDGLKDTYKDEAEARQTAIDSWNIRRKLADIIQK